MRNVYDIKTDKNLNFILPLKEMSNKNLCLELKKKTLIIIHLYYIDSIDYYLKFVKLIPNDIDIIFTISNKKVKEILENSDIVKEKKYKIVEKNNRGRDISSFLVACREYILEYDYICFLHDKKEKDWKLKDYTEIWIQCLWENMVGSSIYIENILLMLNNNPTLGLLVPPFPISEEHTMAYENTWSSNFTMTKALADKMELVCNLDINKPPIALGTIFWAKVDALKKLFEIEWSYEDFDEEPLKDDGTLSHTIERILPFVAQDAGYETGWVMTNQYAGVRFEYMQSVIKTAFERLSSSLNIWKISELNDYKIQQNKLMKFVDKYNEFYIYGAGMYGKKCFAMLKDIQRIPKAFLVSDMEGNPNNIQGVEVALLSKIVPDSKFGIIIATNDKYREDILKSIYSQFPNFLNVYFYKH